MKDWKGNAIKFCFIGETGTGKTRAAGSFPKPFLFSFDGGIDTLGGMDIDCDVYIDGDRRNPSAYTRFRKDWETVSKDSKYETIILDNVTYLSKCILDQLIYENQLVDKNLGDKCWDLFRILKNRMYDVVTSTMVTQKYVISSFLPEWEVDKNSGEMRVLPSTEGKFRQEIPAWFGEVYYFHTEKKPGVKDPRHYIRTKTDGKFIAKSRLDEALKKRGKSGMPEFIDNFCFDTLKQYLEV